MNVYGKETEKPYGYLSIDNQPKTTMNKQVLTDVFGNCYTYPHITRSTHTVPEISQSSPEMKSRKRLTEQSEVKHLRPNQSAKKSKVEPKKPPVKTSKANPEKPPAKRKQTEKTQMKRKVTAKPLKSKRTQKKQPRGYKPRFMVSLT